VLFNVLVTALILVLFDVLVTALILVLFNVLVTALILVLFNVLVTALILVLFNVLVTALSDMCPCLVFLPGFQKGRDFSETGSIYSPLDFTPQSLNFPLKTSSI
jgi:hypothetical protein